jgi:hypothetical protein
VQTRRHAFREVWEHFHLAIKYLVLLQLCWWVIGMAPCADAGWITIENDADEWSLVGPHEIPQEYEHTSPSGTVTALFAGSSMTTTVEGRRIVVFGQGGPYSCGQASVRIDGHEAAALIDWPFLPVDKQAVWISRPLTTDRHEIEIKPASEVAIDFIRVWQGHGAAPEDRLPRLPVAKKPGRAPGKPPMGRDGGASAVSAGTYEHKLCVPIDELPSDRRYIVHLPPKPAANMALVLAIHGVDGSARGMMEYSGFNEKADSEKFIVAYPESSRAWLSGRDHPYLLKVVEDVQRRYRSDPTVRTRRDIRQVGL